MMRRRTLITPALALSVAMGLVACGGSDSSSPPNPRTALANQLSAVSAKLDLIAKANDDSSAEFASTGATLAAAAVITGADIQTVSVTTDGTTSDYQVVAAQQRAPEAPESSPDFSAIIAWKDQSDYVITYAHGQGTASFGGPSPVAAWGGLFNPPSTLWEASAGTTTLTRTSLGGACQNLSGNNPNLQSCNLATYTGSLDITGTVAGPNTTGTARTFSFGSHTIGGIYIVGKLSNTQ